MVKPHMRKHIIENVIYREDIRQELKEMKQIQWQDHPTPLWLVDQMIESVDDIQNKKVLVLFNLQFLEELIHKYEVPRENIKFIADVPFEGEISKEMYFVQTKLCSKNEDWQKLLTRRATNMGIKHFDVVFSNPPYNRGIDLKIMHAVSEITDEMVLVHPSTWLIDLKGKSKLFNDTKEYFGNSIKSVTLFNGNPVFGIGLFVPCSITHIDRHKDPEAPIDVEHFGRKFKVNNVNDITNFGPEWETIVKPFMKKIQAYVKEHGGVWDHNVKELVEGKHHCQLAAIRGNVNMASNGDPMSITQDDFYTMVMKDSNKNKGIRKPLTGSANDMPVFEFDYEAELYNFIGYLKTFFARFCLSLYKIKSDVSKGGELKIVPWLDFTQEWTDEKLFEKFGVDEKTQEYMRGFLPDYYDLG